MDILFWTGYNMPDGICYWLFDWTTAMKNVAIFSDFEFDHIAPDISEEARASAWELWRDDLTTNLSKEQLIIGSNSILYYFGSKVLVTDLAWDEDRNCFLWEVEQDQ